MTERTMEKVKKMFSKDLFAKELGIVITEIDDGSATASIATNEKMLNGAGNISGGVVSTLIDFALAVAANSSGEGISNTMNININYCKPVAPGSVITAKAARISQSGKSTSCNIIATDQNNDVIAVAHGMAYKSK